MDVGARQAGVSISESVDLLGFFVPHSGFIELSKNNSVQRLFSMLNLELDGLEHQKTMLSASHFTLEQEIEATIHMGSPGKAAVMSLNFCCNIWSAV